MRTNLLDLGQFDGMGGTGPYHDGIYGGGGDPDPGPAIITRGI